MTDETILEEGPYKGWKCKDVPLSYWGPLFEKTLSEEIKDYVASRYTLYNLARQSEIKRRAN